MRHRPLQVATEFLLREASVAEGASVDDDPGSEQHAVLDGQGLTDLAAEVDLVDDRESLRAGSSKDGFRLFAHATVGLSEQRHGYPLTPDGWSAGHFLCLAANRSARSCGTGTYIVYRGAPP